MSARFAMQTARENKRNESISSSGSRVSLRFRLPFAVAFSGAGAEKSRTRSRLMHCRRAANDAAQKAARINGVRARARDM